MAMEMKHPDASESHIVSSDRSQDSVPDVDSLGVKRVQLLSAYITPVDRIFIFFGVFLIAYVYGLDGQVRVTYQVCIFRFIYPLSKDHAFADLFSLSYSLLQPPIMIHTVCWLRSMFCVLSLPQLHRYLASSQLDIFRLLTIIANRRKNRRCVWKTGINFAIDCVLHCW